jgi:hypothetical protein
LQPDCWGFRYAMRNLWARLGSLTGLKFERPTSYKFEEIITQACWFSPTPRPVFNTSKSERSFFPIEQWCSSWWSPFKPFPERSHHLGHGLSRVLSLMQPHTCHQALLDRVTACVSHTENPTKFCGCGKTRVHYLAHCCQSTFLHYTACCALLFKLILSLRSVLSGCTVNSRSPCTMFSWFATHLRLLYLRRIN